MEECGADCAGVEAHLAHEHICIARGECAVRRSEELRGQEQKGSGDWCHVLVALLVV